MKNTIERKAIFYPEYLSLLIISILFLISGCVGENPDARVSMLRCEYLDEPMGIDMEAPRFTWAFDSCENGFKQSAYQIRVATIPDDLRADRPDMWNSGKIKIPQARAVYNGKPLSSHTRYYWDVLTWDQDGRVCRVSDIACFETSKLLSSDWSAKWITDEFDPDYRPAPLFRNVFPVEKEVRYARAYVTGLGYYELFINGQRVGDKWLDPGYTHFDKRVLYSTYDVGSLLKEGKNAVALVLGNGWFNEQSVAVWDFHKASWRKRPQAICEIRVTFSDGSTEVWGTDEQWRCNTGAFTFNNIYSGDIYDARKEEPGWMLSDFDDSAWKPARAAAAPAPLLQSQLMPAIEVVKEISPVSVKMFGNTIRVFDLGKNIAGGCRLRVKGPAGTRITLKHGELLKEDGRLELGNINIYFRPVDKNEIFQTDEFILRGDSVEEIFYPRFSYHGFQYVEVESSQPVNLTKESLTGMFVHTNVEPVGEFSCSNDLLNKIWAATNLSYLGNLHSIPTDCPQREKNGWTADAHAAMDLALLNYDGIKFYEKWMNDFLDNQRPAGDISGIIPSAGWGYGPWIGPVWDAALFIIPKSLYTYYGDTLAMSRMYDACNRYLEYLKTREEKDGLLNYGLGDWLPYKTTTPVGFTSSCFYYWDYRLMADFATAFGYDPVPYLVKADTLKSAINRKYFSPDSASYSNGSQAALGTALFMGLVPEGWEQKVADRLARSVQATDKHLDFGLLGSKFVPTVLTRYGYVDLAYDMVAQETAPSWGAWIKNGASTLAETWVMSPAFNDASLNHVFMGDVSAWMYKTLAGINYEESSPGFENIVFRPYFVKDLSWAKAKYRAVCGPIAAVWERGSDGIVTYRVSVPANSTASVYLPVAEVKAPSGVRYDKKTKCYHLGSGNYEFVIGK